MKRIGYAQVEPNHLSARYTGQIYAQLPAMTATTSGGTTTVTPIPQLENGQFLRYNYAAGRASVDGSGEWMLVYNEEKLYDERRQHHKDFAMKAADMTDGKIYPRLLKTNIGDIFTTNAFGGASAGPDAVKENIPDLALGNFVTVGNDGWLAKATGNLADLTAPVFQVVPHFSQFKDDGTIEPAHSTVKGKEVYAYTLPDMQDAVKLQRVK
jgi:hypothetical protein